jgi:hypothetical protein
VAVPITSWFLQKARVRIQGVPWNLLARLATLSGLPIVAVVTWFWHAQHLDVIGGNPLFHLRQNFWEWTHLIYTWPFFSMVFGRCIHLFLLWPTAIFMVWRWRALLRVLRCHRMLGAWFVVNLAFVVSLGGHYFHHYYYALPLVLPIGCLVGAFVAEATNETRWPDAFATLFLGVTAATSIIRTTPLMPPITFDAAKLSQALDRLGPSGLALVTDSVTPVVSLVILRRMGWATHATELTPERIADYRRQGATLLVESSFGGWLPDATRAALGTPLYTDDQVRSYLLKP